MWRPTGVWDITDLTFSRQSGRWWLQGCQPYMPTMIYSPGRFLVLISIRGWVNVWAVVWLEWLGILKSPMTSLESEPKTFQLVALHFNQLCSTMPHQQSTIKKRREAVQTYRVVICQWLQIFRTTGSQMAVILSALCAGCILLPRHIFWYSFLLEAESTPRLLCGCKD
jgi:hypothetical protein